MLVGVRGVRNPKIGRVDDAEIVGNRIAEDGPVFRHLHAQEMQNGSAEVVVARVASVVGHAAQLIPSSSSSNAFARRVSRVSAFPSRTRPIKPARIAGSRKPPRIMSATRIISTGPSKPFFAYRWNRGIVASVSREHWRKRAEEAPRPCGQNERSISQGTDASDRGGL